MRKTTTEIRKSKNEIKQVTLI